MGWDGMVFVWVCASVFVRNARHLNVKVKHTEFPRAHEMTSRGWLYE